MSAPIPKETSMNHPVSFDNLFIFEMANNHQGSVEHGLRIIQEMAQIAKTHHIRAAIKFQFRELDTFIHPAHRVKTDNKHIPRFQSTRLARADFETLLEASRRAGLIPMCTPFDEASVDQIVSMGFDILKIGSCSASDWPLLEKASISNLPIIVSTGGLSVKQIDDLASFFDHRKVRFAMMHCVGIYPTPDDRMELNQIDFLRRRYPDVTIGLSSHEDPSVAIAAQMAVAKGARMYERHIGVGTDTFKLNAYSSGPAQAEAWVAAILRAQAMCGTQERRTTPEEQASLSSLKRGVFARKGLTPGNALTIDDIYFAMPIQEGQLSSGEWRDGVLSLDELSVDAPLMRAKLKMKSDPDAQVLFTAIHSMKGMLNEARVALNTEFKAEFSHHYGIPKFLEWGTTIIECINRDYAKKILIMLPGQKHPSHFHKRKEESFQVLYGTLEVEVDGRHRTLLPGDLQLVPQGVWHRFWSDTGAIFEEISSTHYNDDSFYEDKVINIMPRNERKTLVNNWGRYQIGPFAESLPDETIAGS